MKLHFHIAFRLCLVICDNGELINIYVTEIRQYVYKIT